MNIKALVIDDELFAREAIKAYLKKHANVEVLGECASGLEALNSIQCHKPDLIFLDIQMPELNGFEVLREMDLQDPPVIIFTTAYDNFALKAFNANAVDYLLKPFDQERFDASLNKAVYYLNGRTKEQSSGMVDKLLSAYRAMHTNDNEYLTRILIKEPKKYFFVKVDEILWFEASGDYVTVHKEGKTHLINDSLNNLEQSLDPSKFVRIHRSTIVNLDFIQELHPHFNGEFFITLKNGSKVKLSRTYREAAKHIFGL